MKKPNNDDAKRCLDLRCQAKQGIRPHPEDTEFCEKMYRLYPEWYESLESVVFEKTKPFGSV